MVLHNSALQLMRQTGAPTLPHKHAAAFPCLRPAAPAQHRSCAPAPQRLQAAAVSLEGTRARPAAAAAAAAAAPAATLARGRPRHKMPSPPSLPQFLEANDPQDLTGFTVRLKSSGAVIGRVTGVLLGGGGQLEAASKLLRVELQATLHPFQFKGREKHLLPMVPDIISHVDSDARTLFAQLPKGFLELGRRSLYLSYLRLALPAYAQPLGPDSHSSISSSSSSNPYSSVSKIKTVSSSSSSSSRTKRDGSRSLGAAAAPHRNEGGVAGGRKGEVPGAHIMPTRAVLEAHGQRDLVQLIMKAGGFRQVALDLGYHMPNLKRPAGFLQDLETLDAEISEFIAHAWVTIDDGLRPYYYNQVTGAITMTRPSLATQPQSDRQRVLPTASHFKAASRGDIHYAIVTHHGGYRAAAEALGRRPVNQPETSEWLSRPQLLKEELVGLARELGLQDNQLPSEQQLLAAGRADVLHAVRLLGGFPTAAQQLGLHSHRTSSRGSLKDLDTAASAFMLFRLQQLLQQQKHQHAQQQVSHHHQQQQSRSASVGGSEALDLDMGLASSPPSARLVPQLRARLDPLRLPFPKIRELVQADRYDLIYAQRQHDKQELADRLLFSDIDGTLMHDPGLREDARRAQGVELLVTPPSASGRVGVISADSIKMVGQYQEKGLKFVLVTGARLSTLLMRLPYLPRADALVCENGGRIFYPESHLPTACPLVEDSEWRRDQAAAGPAGQDVRAPEDREGILWDYYRKLKADGWPLDANGYTTSFRMMVKGKSQEQLKAAIAEAPKELQCTFNLGHADFYPATSGKIGAARHLMKHFSASFEESTFMCDDDNDLDLAAIVGKAFLPTHTADSVTRAILDRPQHFVSATKEGTEATEEMLRAIGEYYFPSS